MSATNHTANYELSQYIGSDEPKYLTDYNGDMSKIDVAIKGVDTKAETATSGVATNATAIGALDTAVGSLQTQVTTVAGVANGNTGSINTINSLIGNGEPTTQDKTIIGAINEIAAGATTPSASSVTFDKTGTDLDATNVQAAIVEVNAKIPQGGAVEADDVVYDNTSSGLTATNVQAAIDEVNGKFGGSQIRYDGTSQAMQYSADGGTTWANFRSAISVTDVDSEVSSSVPITHTLVSSHEELLISCFLEVYGATGTNAEIAAATSLTINNANATLTKFHESTPSIGGSGVTIVLQEYHIEGAEAGDVLTFTLNKTYTTVQAEAHLYAID